ncbi:dnaJ homolog subfamily C member 17 isoform X4 [Motacilla alba alba]|uniref:dnaJ homolog subfamily C member 17 isoform X4 n=1 Tax=Motacilla alba alba TaxID=1094192 RepID=UPI0018D58A89|nr:dnaJ homolog subfamily C member 17 isoform X4 [Motacilla alba alba]
MLPGPGILGWCWAHRCSSQGKDAPWARVGFWGGAGLTDAAARAAYDRVRRAKKEAAARTQKLDEKRKKVKLDLEAREREAQSQENEEEEIRITRSLEEEIIRLREEGSRQLEEQQRLVREQIRLEREQHSRGKQERNGAEGKITPKLKIRWKCRKEDETGGGYSKDVLLQILQKYGDVLNLLISSRKTGSAVVEFATVKAAEMAVKNEVGLLNNPLKISWLEGQPQSRPSTVLPDSTGQPRSSQETAQACRVLMATRSLLILCSLSGTGSQYSLPGRTSQDLRAKFHRCRWCRSGTTRAW